jgi:uncharacterized membrane protein
MDAGPLIIAGIFQDLVFAAGGFIAGFCIERWRNLILLVAGVAVAIGLLNFSIAPYSNYPSMGLEIGLRSGSLVLVLVGAFGALGNLVGRCMRAKYAKEKSLKAQG